MCVVNITPQHMTNKMAGPSPSYYLRVAGVPAYSSKSAASNWRRPFYKTTRCKVLLDYTVQSSTWLHGAKFYLTTWCKVLLDYTVQSSTWLHGAKFYLTTRCKVLLDYTVQRTKLGTGSTHSRIRKLFQVRQNNMAIFHLTTTVSNCIRICTPQPPAVFEGRHRQLTYGIFVTGLQAREKASMTMSPQGWNSGFLFCSADRENVVMVKFLQNSWPCVIVKVRDSTKWSLSIVYYYKLHAGACK